MIERMFCRRLRMEKGTKKTTGNGDPSQHKNDITEQEPEDERKEGKNSSNFVTSSCCARGLLCRTHTLITRWLPSEKEIETGSVAGFDQIHSRMLPTGTVNA